MDKLKFTELKLSPEILKSVTDMGFEETTPIQSLAIPKMIEGVDLAQRRLLPCIEYRTHHRFHGITRCQQPLTVIFAGVIDHLPDA